ncbi:MAG: Gfo/Idh/MocA family oxidoreductase [Planctomycetales bacterium]|nr:Gfo/Idh/MocA family oxidoreductase [Planctomycetales bacterium]
MTQSTPEKSRRTFLQESAAVAASGAIASTLAMAPRVHAAGDEVIKVGVVGTGGRGSGAVLNALEAEPRAQLVAAGDVFEDRLKSSISNLKKDPSLGSRVTVDDDHLFSGFDNFKKVIDSDIDVVILTTPPHFRPEHLRYAVEKGKHCFVEKPVGVDAPGIKSVGETCEMAKAKGLSIVSGLCWRYDKAVLETMQRIQDGAIGDIMAIQSEYNAGLLWHRGNKPEWSPMEYQMRNWMYFTWLSGDHICEQAVHSLDKTAWLLGDISPVSAYGMGGRQQRTDDQWGHIYDHHAIVYTYPNDMKVYFYCRQQKNVKNHVDEWVIGTKGQAEILANQIHGENKWRYKGDRKSMYVLEHEALFASIRDGKPINNGHYMCNSSMLAVLGRMCTYTGQEITWDQAINSEQRLGPEKYEWGPAPEVEVAIPGITPFV